MNETWLARGLIEGSFGETANLGVGVECGGQATEQPLLILIHGVCHARNGKTLELDDGTATFVAFAACHFAALLFPALRKKENIYN